jgi:pimeloyl-ACP methyl ester carboxylesterase
MPVLTLKDETRIYYKDWGVGPTVVFSHGWPLNADMWENQMMFLASEGFRVVAPDRRGFGRSDQPWEGYDHDTFSEDLSQLIEALDLKDITLAGYAMGGGEIARYVGRHGTSRVARMVLIGATTPKLAWSNDYPQGVPEAVFDGVRAGLKADRAEFLRGFSRLFFGADRDGAEVSEGSMMQLHQIAMQSSLKAAHDSITACAVSDYREDLNGIDIPVLIIHGEDDAFVPLESTARQAAALIPTATLKIYEGAPHGLLFTHKERLNADLLAFLRG